MLLLILVSVLSGVAGAWLYQRYRIRRFFGEWKPKLNSSQVPGVPYVVSQTEPSGFSRVLYEGDDLSLAKQAYFKTDMPRPSVVELFTHGNHTASKPCQ